MPAKGFTNAVRIQCYDALEAAGFTRFRKEGVDWPLHPGFHAWIGLNTGVHNDHVRINPFVGVHVEPIERLWTSMTSGRYVTKYDRGVATYAIHLGHLDGGMPFIVCAEDEPAASIKAKCSELAQTYRRVGLPYSQSIASYEALLPLFRKRLSSLGANPEKYAACLYLMGDLKGSLTFCQNFLEEHRDYFESFAIPFLEFLRPTESSNSDQVVA